MYLLAMYSVIFYAINIEVMDMKSYFKYLT